MRTSGLLPTLLLAGGSTLLPHLIFNSVGLDHRTLGLLVNAAQEERSGEAFDNRAMAQLKALKDGQPEDVPLGNLAALNELAQRGQALQRQGDVAAALVQAFGERRSSRPDPRAQVLDDCEQARRFYRSVRPSVLAALKTAVALTLLVVVLGAFSGGRSFARFWLGLTFGLSGRWLVLLSLGASAFFVASRFNPWPLLPPELLAAPVGFMLGTGLFLRILDPNYPLWNTALAGLGSPIAACLAVAGLRLIPARIP